MNRKWTPNIVNLNPLTWQQGRAFVYNEQGEIEYFKDFQEYQGKTYIRAYCGGLRELEKCRPLDYVCNPKYLKDYSLRCLKSGNPCGTDTWVIGHPCDCVACQEWIKTNLPGG